MRRRSGRKEIKIGGADAQRGVPKWVQKLKRDLWFLNEQVSTLVKKQGRTADKYLWR
jgi:hypothetical protein